MTTPPQPPQPPYGSQPSYGAYPEQSQATLALVLGIIGLVVCGVAAPFAWSIGQKEVAAIDAGRRPPENRSTANAGRIIGIIGTILLGIGILVGIIVLALVIVGSTTTS